MAQDVRIENQNWIMIPISGSSLTLPDDVGRNWLLVVSGIASIEFENTTDSWVCEDFKVLLDLKAPLDYAKQVSNLPQDGKVTFDVEQYSLFVTINSAYNTSGNAFSIDDWDILLSPDPLRNRKMFDGITFRAVRIDKADIYRVGFQITLFGSLGGFGILD